MSYAVRGGCERKKKHYVMKIATCQRVQGKNTRIWKHAGYVYSVLRLVGSLTGGEQLLSRALGTCCSRSASGERGWKAAREPVEVWEEGRRG